MANGIPILGTITQKCTVDKISNYEFKIVLTQGLNRQITKNVRVFRLRSH